MYLSVNSGCPCKPARVASTCFGATEVHCQCMPVSFMARQVWTQAAGCRLRAGVCDSLKLAG